MRYRVDWRQVSLNEIAHILNAKRIPLNSRDREKRKGIFPYYGASGVVDYIDDYLFEGEHVLISEDGENLRTRKTPIAFKADGKFWVNNHAHIVKGKASFLNDYIVYFFQNLDLTPYITGAVQPKLNKENLLSIPILVPSKNENIEWIVEILKSLDDKIEINRQINQTLEEIAQALFEHYFMDNGDSIIRVDQYIEFNPRISIPKGKEVPFVDMKAVPNIGMNVNEVIVKAFNAGSKFQKNDTLLARITPCLENGKTAFVNFLEEDECGFGSTEFITMRAKKDICPQFVYCLARNTRFRQHAIGSMVGSSGRQRIQLDMLQGFLIPAVEKEKILRFKKATEAGFEMINRNRKEIFILEKQRDILLPKLISGEINIEK